MACVRLHIQMMILFIVLWYRQDGQRPLHVVATSGREDMVAVIEALLKTGSDVNATTTTDEDTVLHLVIKHAVLRLAFQSCLMILEHNPDLDIRNKVMHFRFCWWSGWMNWLLVHAGSIFISANIVCNIIRI